MRHYVQANECKGSAVGTLSEVLILDKYLFIGKNVKEVIIAESIYIYIFFTLTYP